MRIVVGDNSKKIDGQKNPVPAAELELQQNQTKSLDKSVRAVIPISAGRISFGDLARFAWPSKAESNLSHLTGYDARTCRRWLAGDTEPPAEAAFIVLTEIMKRYQR